MTARSEINAGDSGVCLDVVPEGNGVDNDPFADFFADAFDSPGAAGGGGLQFIGNTVSSSDPLHAGPDAPPIEAARAELVDAARSYGFALTVSGGLSGGGIASIAGGPAFEFASTDELANRFPDVYFVTHASESAFSAAQGLRQPSLRHGSFFSTPVAAIAIELGLKLSTTRVGRDDQAAHGVEVLAETFNRTVRIASDLGLIPNVDVPGQCLSGLIASHCVTGVQLDAGSVPNSLAVAVPQMLRFPLPLAGEASGRDLVLRLTLSRLDHYRYLASQPVPHGAWSQVPKDELHLDRWLAPSASPVIAKVQIRSPKGLGQLAFGRLARNRMLMPSAWLSGPELAALTPMLNLSIEDMYCSYGHQPAAEALGIGEVQFGPFASGSVSSGLVAEALVAAMCQAAVGAHVPDGVALTSAWLASCARARIIDAAQPLLHMGITPLEMGHGHLTVSMPVTSLPKLRALMLAGGPFQLPAGWRHL